MTRLHQFILLLILCAIPLKVDAANRVTFQEPPTVAIRQTNRVLVRGELQSVDSEKVVLRVGTGFTAKEVDVDVSTISTLRTTDGEIQFKASDGINTFINEMSSRSDVDITLVEDATPATTDANDTPAVMNGGFGPSTANTGRGNGNSNPAMNPVLNGGFGPTGNQTSSLDSPTVGNSEATEIVVCDNCKKEVAVNAQYGQKCPHCGILWDIDAPSATDRMIASAGGARNDVNGSQTATGGAVRPVVQQAAQAPDGVAPQSINNPPAPVSIENLPLWMKASIFFGCIGVMYYFFFYRA